MQNSLLTGEALSKLGQFQGAHSLRQGVYQLFLRDTTVYIGKAANVRARLEQHWEKLRGRRNLNIREIFFKCLILHRNWTPVTNEGLLISHYQAKGECKWNGAGFGPKDVGSVRDDSQPNWFDINYPINDEWPCEGVGDHEAVGTLLANLKEQLPFTFRFKVSPEDAA